MTRRTFVAAACLVVGLFTSRVEAAAPPVTVTVSPETLELCPGESRRVQVVVRNEGSAAAHDVRLSSFTTQVAAPELAVGSFDPVSGNARRLEPGAALVAVATVSATQEPFGGSAAVLVRASYRLEGPPRVESVGVAKLEVRRPALPPVDALKAEVRPAFDTLHEKDEKTLTLLLTNAAAVPLTVKSIRASAAPGTTLAPKGPLPTRILSQQVAGIVYGLTVDRDIVPGKHIASFEIEAETTGACGATLRQFPTYEVRMGVYGESELLKLVDVPSVLFLPGFLVLATMMLLWTVPALRLKVFKSESFPLSAKDPQFWLIGIALSFLLGATAPRFAIGAGGAYSLERIAGLWKFSVVAGALAYGLAFGLERALLRRRKQAHTADQIQLGDDPLTVLGKMSKRDWPLAKTLPVKSAKAGFQGHMLWETDDPGRVWVVPRIAFILKNGDPAPEFSKAPDARTQFQLASEALEKGGCELDWMPWVDQAGMGPRAVAPDDLAASGQFPFIDVMSEDSWKAQKKALKKK